jgi:hypothetical protein
MPTPGFRVAPRGSAKVQAQRVVVEDSAGLLSGMSFGARLGFARGRWR